MNLWLQTHSSRILQLFTMELSAANSSSVDNLWSPMFTGWKLTSLSPKRWRITSVKGEQWMSWFLTMRMHRQVERSKISHACSTHDTSRVNLIINIRILQKTELAQSRIWPTPSWIAVVAQLATGYWLSSMCAYSSTFWLTNPLIGALLWSTWLDKHRTYRHSWILNSTNQSIMLWTISFRPNHQRKRGDGLELQRMLVMHSRTKSSLMTPMSLFTARRSDQHWLPRSTNDWTLLRQGRRRRTSLSRNTSSPNMSRKTKSSPEHPRLNPRIMIHWSVAPTLLTAMKRVESFELKWWRRLSNKMKRTMRKSPSF